ncbi:MAG: cache domain-containing protein [Poseidonibacter sp.]|uniref:sensor histidine kinase n=1 Tax=Poseidonibacter sp. TaxID=2321188 RepID=UPI00359D0077
MNIKNEKKLLFILRYSLPAFILFSSFLITLFLYFENKSNFETIKKDMEEKYVLDKKQVIKEQIETVYDYILSEQKDTESKLKESLKTRVYEAHKIITNIYSEYKDKYSKKEIDKLIKTSIKDIRFNNNRGYFFVYDKNAINIIHPLVPSLEGKNLINHKDSKGTFVLKDSLNLLEKNDESYQEWYWRKTKDSLYEYKKIGFIKNIYELDYFIGTGEYVEDFSLDIQEKVLTQLNKLKFGKNSYLIVVDKNGKYLLHINKDLIGKSVTKKLKKWNESDIFKESKKIASQGGYLKVIFNKPDSVKPSEKIVYVKSVPNWDWDISTGFYKDDVNKLINQRKEVLTKNYNENVKRVFIFAFIVTTILLLLSFYISRIIKKRFEDYKKDIKHHIDENHKQNVLLSQKIKLAAMGEMMENVAHQWRQPLSLITTASSGIKFQKDLDLLTDESLIESVDRISETANHLSQTIEDFRDFFKPDKEKISFVLNKSIEKTLNLLYSRIKNKEIIVIKSIEDVTIEGFERELLQVLMNLLNNAIDALEEKEGQRYIFIDVISKKENVILKIKDNAGGIDDEVINRVFEPYFTTKHKSQGTGIGLHMSQEIISRHMDGVLEVSNTQYTYKNKSYKGAVFSMKIPFK